VLRWGRSPHAIDRPDGSRVRLFGMDDNRHTTESCCVLASLASVSSDHGRRAWPSRRSMRKTQPNRPAWHYIGTHQFSDLLCKREQGCIFLKLSKAISFGLPNLSKKRKSYFFRGKRKSYWEWILSKTKNSVGYEIRPVEDRIIYSLATTAKLCLGYNV